MTKKADIRIVRSFEEFPSDWDTFVDSRANGRLFHRRIWLEILADVYGYDLNAAVAIDEAGQLTGILPAFAVRSFLTGKRMISAPFSYLCGPVGIDGDVEARLIEVLKEDTRKQHLQYFESKSDRPLPAEIEGMQSHSEFITYRLDLRTNEETLWNGLHKSMIQRGIKKAQKEGVEVESANFPGDAAVFDRLNKITCRKHGIPAQPSTFFRAVFDGLMPAGLAACYLARLSGQVVAGIVVFFDKERAVYMYGASLPEFLPARPNHLLLWEAIKKAKERGLTEFDFGRVSPENTGLAEFKQRWGAAEIPLTYSYWPDRKGVGVVDRTSLKFRLTTAVFSKLPLAVSGRLSWLYRHLA